MKTLGICAAAVVAGRLFAQANDQGAASADQILVRVAEFYRNFDSFRFQLHYEMQSHGSGGARPREYRLIESFRSPARWRYDFRKVEDDALTITRRSDGKSKWVFQPSTNEYTEEPSERVEGSFTSSLGRVAGEAATAKLAGEEPLTVAGQKFDCYIIETAVPGNPNSRLPARTRRYWIAKGPFVVLKRIEESTASLEDRVVTNTETITAEQFRLDPDIPQSFFSFTPAPGVQKVTRLSAPEQRQTLKAGDMAPSFRAKDLNGQDQDSSQLKGKHVVLTFWGSWCGPCREELPTLDLLYRAFQRNALAVLAMAGLESPDTSREYLESHHLVLPSWTDADDSVARKFGVQTWPSTFLIGPDGLILYTGSGSSIVGLQEALRKAGIWSRR